MDAETYSQYAEIVNQHDQIIIDKSCALIDFYESFELDGKRTVYFGTEKGYAQWKTGGESHV